MDSETKVGTIEGFVANPGSGIAHLLIRDDGEEHERMVPCDNGPTVRALDAAFGNFIVPGHRVDPAAIRGKRISYTLTDYGTLEGFEPIE